jgi:phospholipase/carboxylesterase
LVLDYIEKVSGDNPRYTIIWMHGLGADGHDFEGIVPALNLPKDSPVRFIFPHAPTRPITINGGMVMRGWYDITGLEIVRHEDAEGLQQSAALVSDLIQKENERGIDSERIFLAGFSQGGAVALYMGLRYPTRLAGIIALSTYLPLSGQTRAEATDANRDIPIFMAHGLLDPVLVTPLGETSMQMLKELGYEVEWHTYTIQHTVCDQEIVDLSRWLHRELSD